jgi:uncharacterized protein
MLGRFGGRDQSIACGADGQLHNDAFTSRMSKAKFGDRIPQLVETTDKANMSDPMDLSA